MLQRLDVLQCHSLSLLTVDGWILFAARFFRLFSYGCLGVSLYLYLIARDLDEFDVGVLFTFTLIGDLVVTFILTTSADAWGRRRTLIVGGLLKLFAGVAFAFTGNIFVLVLAGTLGVITPTGGEIGPFLAVEQAALTEIITDKAAITAIFGWYNMLGYFALASGALTSGFVMKTYLDAGYSKLAAYRVPIFAYAVFGLLKTILYLTLSYRVEHNASQYAPVPSADVTTAIPAPSSMTVEAVEDRPPWFQRWFGKFGLRRSESRRVVLKLSALFILDAFAGGFVMQSLIVFWFKQRFNASEDKLGAMLLGANILAGLSALAVTPMVARIGAINTMVVTHLPSNVFLVMIPFMPNLNLALAVLFIRFSISQMDVPARQTYVALTVDADERSAAGGITNLVRSAGVAVSPLFSGLLLKQPVDSLAFKMPFILGGGLKIVYDLLLYYSFKTSSPLPVSAPTISTAAVANLSTVTPRTFGAAAVFAEDSDDDDNDQAVSNQVELSVNRLREAQAQDSENADDEAVGPGRGRPAVRKARKPPVVDPSVTYRSEQERDLDAVLGEVEEEMGKSSLTVKR